MSSKQDSHLPDSDLLLLASGEGDTSASLHLHACAVCRERQSQLESQLRVISSVLRDASVIHEPERPRLTWMAGAAAALTLAVLGGWFAYHTSGVVYAEAPDRQLTPGAVRASMNVASVCSAEESETVRIPHARAMLVFQRYAIDRPGPRQFEVDFLIPPDLGGSDDPENLWPQPYASGVWNSRVKDALEDRLRAMVCNGEMDLATAQRELSRDWIASYQKLFRTSRPLMDHAGFVKDRPWE